MKKGLFLAAVVLCALVSFAQDEEEPKKGFQKEKLFIGGNFGLTFGDFTLINVSPQVGYRFNRYLAAGLGINAQFASEKQRFLNGDLYYKTSQGIAGLNVFGRFYPFEYLMLQVQPEGNYRFGKIKFYDGRQPETTKMDAEIIPSILAGGGIVLPSGRGAFIISIMYDVLQDKNSLYGKRPIINFNYNISLY